MGCPAKLAPLGITDMRARIPDSASSGCSVRFRPKADGRLILLKQKRGFAQNGIVHLTEPVLDFRWSEKLPV